MAIFHKATLKPTKTEVLAQWAPLQAWGPASGASIEIIGSYRFDDPEGEVGMETFLFTAEGDLFQVPLTYRGTPLADGEDALIAEMNHSALGTRWVYDGLRDPRYVVMLAGVTMTGQGEALGMVEHDGRWHIAPTTVRISGGGWTDERVPVDRFELVSDEASESVLRNERFDLKFFRRPAPGVRGGMKLTGTWPGQSDPVLLAAVGER